MLATLYLYFLAFVSAALAYQVISPNSRTEWTNQGDQLLTWKRVQSDAATFSVILDNQSVDGFSPILLASNVNGRELKINLSPPNGGWPTGDHFRVNLVLDSESNTIYAQSNEFMITGKELGTSSSMSTSDSTDKGSDDSGSSNQITVTQPQLDPKRPSVTGSLVGGGVSAGPTYAPGASAVSDMNSNMLPIIGSGSSNVYLHSGLLGASLLSAFVFVFV